MYQKVSCGFIFFLTVGALAAQELPGIAVGILDQSNQARQEIAKHNKSAAMDHLALAKTMAADIERKSGSARPIFVAVNQVTDTTTTYHPVKRRGGNVADRLKKSTSIREVDSDVTMEKLNVTAAANRLQEAENALERGDWNAADSALAAIPNGIVRETVEQNSPMAKARANLMFARERVMNDQFKAAAAPLFAAAQALRDYDGKAAPHTAEIQNMREQIDTLAGNVSGSREEILAKIDSWTAALGQWSLSGVK